jgi:organic hydroperoxide reductase OsmC/OhrA
VSEHLATITWKRSTPDFAPRSYSRAHAWQFDSGVIVPASAAPAYRGDVERVDPEEALVASIASCHMLSFLFEAALKKFVVDSYDDTAAGVMTKNEHGKLWVSRVVLRPNIVFGGDQRPSAEDIAALHHLAHENCFIANSVKTEIVVEPRLA